MSNDELLRAILRAQEVRPDSDEMKALQSARADIEGLLRSAFPAPSPTIRYGGSKAKGTMLLDDFDLDLICYFPEQGAGGGETLEELYEQVSAALQEKYRVDPRTTALRVFDQDNDLHIDVVPGRFIDSSETFAFLHQNGGEKRWLQTNLKKHIEHATESGCVDDIRLAKLWKRRSGVAIRTFPLELLVIKILQGSGVSGLDERFRHLLAEIAARARDIAIEDPANSNNNVGDTMDRSALGLAAISSLRTVEQSGWSAIFGTGDPVNRSRAAALRVSVGRAAPTRPWLPHE